MKWSTRPLDLLTAVGLMICASILLSVGLAVVRSSAQEVASGLPDYCDMIQACSGPLWRQTHTCNTWCQCSATADLNRDFDVDLEDFAAFQNAMGGPQ